MNGTGMQGISNVGRLGSFHTIDEIFGRFQITTDPPHPGHQMTGTTVDEVSPSLLVVSQALLDIPLTVIISVEALSGIVVIVEVIDIISELDPEDWSVDEPGKISLDDDNVFDVGDCIDDLSLAMAEVARDKGEVPVVFHVEMALVVGVDVLMPKEVDDPISVIDSLVVELDGI